MNEQISDFKNLINSHLKKHDFKNGIFRSMLPLMVKICGDNQFIFISIQAGENFNSSPKENVSEYDSVEVTFLPFTDDILENYLYDDSEFVNEKIYAFVPIETLAIALYKYANR